MTSEHSQLQHLADMALRQYTLENPKPVFVWHNDGVTFRVDTEDPKKTYVLRIHLPIKGHPPDIRQRKPAITTMLQWLNALNQETTISLQKPIHNTSITFVTEIEHDDQNDFPLYCTLLSWVEGDVNEDVRTAIQADRMGNAVAQLHLTASKWGASSKLIRPRHDWERLHTALRRSKALVDQDVLDQKDFSIVEQAAEVLYEDMIELGEDRNAWGILHDDLHPGNFRFLQDDIGIIDFNSCCWGHYLYDIAWVFLYEGPKNRGRFLEAYEKVFPLPHNAQSIIEAFHIGAMIELAAYWMPIEKPERSKKRIDCVALESKVLLSGESFLFDAKKTWWEASDSDW